MSSPALGLTVKVPALKSLLGKIMSSIWPGLALGNELDPTKISHDPDVVAAYIDDPLVHDRVSARWFTEFLTAMATTHRLASQLKVPLLMQLAGDDHLTDVDASRQFFDRLTSKTKRCTAMTIYITKYTMRLAAQRATVLNDLVNWLTHHVDGTAP